MAAANRQAPIDAIEQWLNAFAGAIRSRDFGLGRSLFAPEVIAFGTRAVTALGIEILVDQQWSHIWNATRGFTFHLSELHSGIEGDFGWAAVPWESQGIAADGHPFQRAGRATYVLQRREGVWLAIHSHHSLNPCPEKLRKPDR